MVSEEVGGLHEKMLTVLCHNPSNASEVSDALRRCVGPTLPQVLRKIDHMKAMVEAVNDHDGADHEIVYFTEAVHGPGGGMSHFSIYSITTNDICNSHCYRGSYQFSRERDKLLEKILKGDDLDAWNTHAIKC